MPGPSKNVYVTEPLDAVVNHTHNDAEADPLAGIVGVSKRAENVPPGLVWLSP